MHENVNTHTRRITVSCPTRNYQAHIISEIVLHASRSINCSSVKTTDKGVKCQNFLIKLATGSVLVHVTLTRISKTGIS